MIMKVWNGKKDDKTLDCCVTVRKTHFRINFHHSFRAVFESEIVKIILGI